MWTLSNRTPYGTDRNWTRDKDGRHVWIVAVKATFDIQPNGALKLADEQDPPSLEPKFYGDPTKTSLKYESDLLAVKPGTDVVLNARAYAPAGKPASQVDVLFRMEGFSKHLIVYGERTYFTGLTGALTTTAAQPFTTCPIIYEYAFGGSDLGDPDPRRQRMEARNPVGRGVAADLGSLVHRPAHRIEYASGAPTRPAGFGAIASWWIPRSEHAGTYDDAWAETKKPLLPDDYDPQHTLMSPLDQRSARWLRGGELAELLNMTPQGGLRFELPRLYFTYRTRFGSRNVEHRGHLATVIIEPDVPRVIVVYQSSLVVPRKDVARLTDTVIQTKEYLR